MHDGMAVRAYREQILDRINRMLLTNFGKWSKVVHVNVSVGDRSVNGSEAETADTTVSAMCGDALAPSVCVTLVGVDHDRTDCTLCQTAAAIHLFG
jgi:hypothetical protein